MKQYTPTFRGFDSFLGYYNSMEDYWTHYGPSATGPCTGIDLSNNTKVDGIHAAARSLNGTYSSDNAVTRLRIHHFKTLLGDGGGRARVRRGDRAGRRAAKRWPEKRAFQDPRRYPARLFVPTRPGHPSRNSADR